MKPLMARGLGAIKEEQVTQTLSLSTKNLLMTKNPSGTHPSRTKILVVKAFLNRKLPWRN
jgi:hypothetical protein